MTKQNEKDAKRVPELRFKGFTDDWEQRKLGEIATIVGGGTPSTKNPKYWDGDINWYSPAEIGNQIYTEKSERQITELGLKKSSAKLLPVGTVLFTSRAGIGKTAILNKEACTNQGFQSIIPRSKMLNSYFLFSRTNSLKQYGETMGSGSTFVEVSGKQMSKMPLFIPNINEQSKIAKLFQSLDKTITLHEEQHRQLEQLKKALLQKMFADETGYPALRFKGFTEKWEQRKLGETVVNIVAGGDINKAELLSKGKYPVYANALTNNGIVGYYASQYRIAAPAVTVTGRGDIGIAKARDINFTPVVRLLAISSQHNNYFLENLINTHRSFAESTGVPQLTVPQLSNYKLYFPPKINEEVFIGRLFKKIDHLTTLHQHKIDNLKRLKRALLQKMFV